MTALKKIKVKSKKIQTVFIQFGAFSRKDYAENSKKEIERKIKKKI